MLSAVIAARPDILPNWSGVEAAEAGRSNKGAWTLAAIGLTAALVLGVLVSPFASSSPDGLEKVAEDKGFIESAEGKETWTSSPLPDYTVPGVDAEGVSTGLAGLLGTAAMFAVGFGTIKLVALRRKEQEN